MDTTSFSGTRRLLFSFFLFCFFVFWGLDDEARWRQPSVELVAENTVLRGITWHGLCAW